MTEEKKESGQEFSWQAPEYEYYHKDSSWYWLSFIVCVILIAFGVWWSNFLFVVFVVIAWLVVANFAGRFPSIWDFKIGEKGIEIGKEKFYSYGEIEGFDIHKIEGECDELVLKMKSKFHSYVKIPIFDGDSEKIEEFLIKFLPKEEYNSSLADNLSKIVRF